MRIFLFALITGLVMYGIVYCQGQIKEPSGKYAMMPKTYRQAVLSGYRLNFIILWAIVILVLIFG